MAEQLTTHVVPDFQVHILLLEAHELMEVPLIKEHFVDNAD